MLEVLGSLTAPPPLLFTTTNRVYDDLDKLQLITSGCRYEPEDELVRAFGISEPRAFCQQRINLRRCIGPCDYVLEDARTLGLRITGLCLGSVYGTHQVDTEMRGWVVHFLSQALAGRPITVVGDGCQVRDILFGEDLVNAFISAWQQTEKLQGHVFNVGGGPTNTISVLELLELIEDLLGSVPNLRFSSARPEGPLYYVSDIRKFTTATGWMPRVSVRVGVTKLLHWLREFDVDAVPPLIHKEAHRCGAFQPSRKGS